MPPPLRSLAARNAHVARLLPRVSQLRPSSCRARVCACSPAVDRGDGAGEQAGACRVLKVGLEEQKSSNAEGVDEDRPQERRDEQRQSVARDGLDDALQQLVPHDDIKQLFPARPQRWRRRDTVCEPAGALPASGRHRGRTSNVAHSGWCTTASTASAA